MSGVRFKEKSNKQHEKGQFILNSQIYAKQVPRRSTDALEFKCMGPKGTGGACASQFPMRIVNYFTLIVFCCERCVLLCSHSNGDLFACEDNLLISHGKNNNNHVFPPMLTWYSIGAYITK